MTAKANIAVTSIKMSTDKNAGPQELHIMFIIFLNNFKSAIPKINILESPT